MSIIIGLIFSAMHIKKIIPIIVILIVLAINLSFGLPRLSTFSAVDEPYWTYNRTPDFWRAVMNKKWKNTDINDKPGITVAILSGIGLFKIDPMPYKSLRGDIKTNEELEKVNLINFSFRLPIFIFTLLLLPLFYFFLQKLFNQTIALFGFLFIGLSPIVLGISLIINPDALLWLFLPLSLLSYFVSCKSDDRKYLYISGVFLGLSLLTKYVANILYVFFFLLPFIEYIFVERKPEITSYLKKSLLNYIILVAISMAVFFVLFPATWVSPSLLLKGTFLSKAFESTWPLFAGVVAFIALDMLIIKNKITKNILDIIYKYKILLINIFTGAFIAIIFIAISETYFGMRFFDILGMITSPKGIGGDPISAILADFYGLIFGIHPLIFIAFLFGIFSLFQKNNKEYSYNVKIIFYLMLFILFYYAASTINNVVATVRYQIILYPFAFIISALGLAQILELLTKKIKREIFQILLVGAIIIILTASLISIRPFYFSYASDILPKNYILNIKDMGDGSYEAAGFLNNLPDAKNINIWSDKGAVCEEFIGECTIGFQQSDLRNSRFDYFIVSAGRKSKTIKTDATHLIDFPIAYSTEEYVKKITIGNRDSNYVKIVPGDIMYKK